MVVPEGHRVSVAQASRIPWINVLEGGALLAQLGVGSDQPEEELAAALRRVDALLREPRRRVLVSHGGELSSLMAPHDPPVTPVSALVVWTLDPDRLAHAPKAVALVQRWLAFVHGLGIGNDLAQAAYFLGASQSPFARGLAGLLAGLGVEVRAPLRRDAAVLIEVVRPDGGVLTALAGSQLEAAADPSAQVTNQARRLARDQRDLARVQRLETEEHEALTRMLAPGAPDKLAALRAPLLRKLTLDTVARGDAARPALYEELLRREVPLLLAIDTTSGGPRGISWPDGAKATPVFGDELCLHATAAGYGWAADHSGVAIVPPRKLFEWAAREAFALALFAEHAKDKRVYVLIEPDESAQLARGALPTRSI